ncbi:MAG: leucine-rich repeat protein, partial [Oscillospiraceae bacterium]|nr:leucine-rich repeat protein [Oscillospiraceae bacterium]
MKTVRSIAALCFAIMLGTAAGPCAAQDCCITANAAEIVSSGTCGKNAVWQLSSDGTFTVSGTGEMYGLYSQFLESWEEEKSDIKTVVIGSGITNVGAQCFSGCPNLTSVTLPDTLTAIHESAFSSCKALTAIA